MNDTNRAREKGEGKTRCRTPGRGSCASTRSPRTMGHSVQRNGWCDRPFRHSQWLWVHNGALRGFHEITISRRAGRAVWIHEQGAAGAGRQVRRRRRLRGTGPGRPGPAGRPARRRHRHPRQRILRHHGPGPTPPPRHVAAPIREHRRGLAAEGARPQGAHRNPGAAHRGRHGARRAGRPGLGGGPGKTGAPGGVDLDGPAPAPDARPGREPAHRGRRRHGPRHRGRRLGRGRRGRQRVARGGGRTGRDR